MIATNGKLVPSDHRIEALGMTEAEFVRDLFQQVADGSSLMEQCRRLEGVPTTRRYNTGKVVTGKSWSASRLSVMLSSTTYIGQHVYHGRYGEVIREVPPLVSRELFNRVRQQLRRNLSRPMSKGRFTLLRGLIRCKNCGAGYVSTTMRPGKYYYRCLRTLAVNVPDREKRCKAGYVPAEKLEEAAWLVCKEVIVDFDFMIKDLGEPRHISKEDDIKRLEQAIAAKANVRQDIAQLVQDGLLQYHEAKARLQAVAQDEAELRGRLAEVESEVELNAIYRQRWEAFKARRSQYGRQLYDIEQDPERKRAVIAELIAPIEVETTGKGRRKSVAVTYQLFDDEEIRGIPLDNL
jgi:hypothetical protein